MTQVYYEEDGARRTLSVQGHASGSPEVCAAVSGIVFALGGYLKNAEAHPEEHYVQLFDFRLESGDALLHATGDKCIESAFEMAAIGLKQIEAKYPDFLSMEYRPAEK